MNNQFALVTVRTSSTRFPNKCLHNIVNEISAIQVVIRRAKKIGCPVILATTEDNSDDVLVDIAKNEKIEYFRGSIKNKIYRWARCFERYNISEAILVDGDDLTFDYKVGARALEQLKSNTSDCIQIHPEMTPGFFTYGITRSGIKKLLSQVPDSQCDTDVISEYILQADLSRKYVVPKVNEKDGHNLRLTIDYLEDAIFYEELYKKVNYLETGPKIVRVALENDLQKINWHRNEEFLKNQKQFNEKISKRN